MQLMSSIHYFPSPLPHSYYNFPRSGHMPDLTAAVPCNYSKHCLSTHRSRPLDSYRMYAGHTDWELPWNFQGGKKVEVNIWRSAMKADHHWVEKQGLCPHSVALALSFSISTCNLCKSSGDVELQLWIWMLAENTGTQTFSIASCADLSTSSSLSMREK